MGVLESIADVPMIRSRGSGLNPTEVRFVQSGNNSQKRRFTTTGRTKDRNEFAGRDVQIDTLNSSDWAGKDPPDFSQIDRDTGQRRWREIRLHIKRL